MPEFGDRTDARREAAKRMIAGGNAAWAPPATWWNMVKGAAPVIAPWLSAPPLMAPIDLEHEAFAQADAERRAQILRQQQAAEQALAEARAFADNRSGGEVVLRGLGNLVKTTAQLGGAMLDLPPQTPQQAQELGRSVAEAAGPAGTIAQYATIAGSPRQSMAAQPIETTLAMGAPLAAAIKGVRGLRAVRAGAVAPDAPPAARVPNIEPQVSDVTPPVTPTAAAVQAAVPAVELATPKFSERVSRIGQRLAPVGAALPKFDVSAPGAMTGAVLGSAVGAPFIGAALGAALPMGAEVVGKVSPVLGRALARKAAAARRVGDDYRVQDEPAVEAVVQNVVTEPVRIGREMQGSGQQVSRVIGRQGMDLDPSVEFATPQVQARRAEPLNAAQAKEVGLEQPGSTVEFVEPVAAVEAAGAHAAKAIDLQADLAATTDMLGELRQMRKAFDEESKQATLGYQQRLEQAKAELRATADPDRRRVLLEEIRQARRDMSTADPAVSPKYKQALAELDAAERELRQKAGAAQREREAAIGAGEGAKRRLDKIKADRDALFDAAKKAKEAKGRAQVAFDEAVATRRAAMADAAARMKSAAAYQKMVKPIKETVSERIKTRIGEEAGAEQLARDTAWAEAKSKQLGDLKKLKAELMKEEYRETVRKWSADALRGRAVGSKAEYWKREMPAAEKRASQRIAAMQADREAAYAKAREASRVYNEKASEVYKQARAEDPDIAEYATAKQEMDEAVAAYKASKDKTAVEGRLEDLRRAAGQQALLAARAKGAAGSVKNIAEQMKVEREARWQRVKERAAEREAALAAKKQASENLGGTERMREDIAQVAAGADIARKGVKDLREQATTTIGKDGQEARLVSGQDVVAAEQGKRPVFPSHPVLRQYVDKLVEYSNRMNPTPFAAEEIAREFTSLAAIDTPGIFRDPVVRGATARRMLAELHGLDERNMPSKLPDGTGYREAMTKLQDDLYELSESQMRGDPQSIIVGGKDALAVAKEIFDNEFDQGKRNKSMATAAEQYGKMIANKLQQEAQARAVHGEINRSRPPLGDAGQDVLPANAVAYAAAKEMLGDAPHTALWAPLKDIRSMLASPNELAPLVRKWAEMQGATVDDAAILATLKKMAQRWSDGVPLIAQHPVAEYINKAHSHGTVGSRVPGSVTLLPGAEAAYTSRITTAEAMANIIKVSDKANELLATISRGGRFGITSGNPAAYVNNISGNLTQNLVVRGLDPARWAWRLSGDVQEFNKWLNDAGDADVMRKWTQINRTGIVKAPAIDRIGGKLKGGWGSSTVAKGAEKVYDAIIAIADEAYQTFGDRAFKVEAASSVYDDAMASARALEPGRVVDWNVGDGRVSRIAKTESGWMVNGKAATIDDVAREAAKAGAAIAQDLFVDVERTGTLTQSIRRSSIASIASPFVTWANRARPTPWQRGFLGDALFSPPSFIAFTNDPNIVGAMFARDMATAAVRSSIASLARQQPGTPDVLVDSYSWGDGPGAIAVWRDDEGRLFAKNFDQGSPFAPTASLFRMGAAATALFDSFVAAAPQDLFVTREADGTLTPVDRDTLTPAQRAQRLRWVRLNSRSNVSEKTVLSFINAAGGPLASMWADASTGKGLDAKKVALTIGSMFTGAIPFGVYDVTMTSLEPGAEIRKRYLGGDDEVQQAESIINYSLRRMLGIGIKPDVPEETLANVLEIRKSALRKSMWLMSEDQRDKAQLRADSGGEDAEHWQRALDRDDAKRMMLDEAVDDLESDFAAAREKLEAARKVKGKPGWVNLAQPIAE